MIATLKKIIKRLTLIVVALAVLLSALLQGAWGIVLVVAGALFVFRFIVIPVSRRVWPTRACFWCRGTGRCFGSNSDRWGKCWFGCDKGGRPRRSAV